VGRPTGADSDNARGQATRLYVRVQQRTLCSMTVMTVSEARARLPELLDRVDGGDEVTITRHGEAVAVVVRPDALRSRRASAAWESAQRIDELLMGARATALPIIGMRAKRAEELISEIMAGREAR